MVMRFGEHWGGRSSLSQEIRLGGTGVPLVFNAMGAGGGFIAGGGDSIFRLTGLDTLATCAR